ncbi:porin [Nitrincola sp. MINF-07-Sa-05]|uniref:porin n=1 Tax=Nitrincola salilacus TaxID=3400273 RepID=UPI0039185920
MKKSLIALAIAGAMTVPAIAMADATLYGHVNISADKADNTKLNINNNGQSTTRIGVRGTADTGMDGLVGFYHIEMGMATDNGSTALSTRLAHAGLKGDFGSFALGTQWTPHYLWGTSATDVMLSNITGNLRSSDVVYRASRSAMYLSPNMGGFQFGAGILASSANSDKNVDAFNVAGQYSANGLTVGLSHISFESSMFNAARDHSTSAAVSYSFGPAMLAASVTHNELRAGGDTTPFELAGTYSVTDSTTLKVAYADHDNSAKGYGVEVQHNLGSMTNLYVGYGEANSTLENRAVNPGADVFSTGIRVRF